MHSPGISAMVILRASLAAGGVLGLAYLGFFVQQRATQGMTPPPIEASVGSGTAQADEEAPLRARVSQFYGSWQQKDIGSIWELLSPAIRADEDEKAYRQEFGSFFEDLTLDEFSIRGVDFRSSGSALVETELKFTVKSESRRVREINRSHWTLASDGKWYYASSVRDTEAVPRTVVSDAAAKAGRR